MNGRFIVFDGVDGAGKSTALQACAHALRERGYRPVCTREPGGSEPSEAIRALLLRDWQPALSAMSELLLVCAARAAHLEATVYPALERGEIVLCDRFTDSSHVYQGVLGGVSADVIDELTARVVKRPPDLTLIFDLPVESSLERMRQRGQGNRFDSEDRRQLQRIRDAFAARLNATGTPERYRRIDADQTLDQVVAQALAQVESCL